MIATLAPARMALALPLLLCLALPVAGQAPPGAGAPQGPVKVGVIALQPQEVKRRSILPGRAVAYQDAAIRPRVTGLVTEILYTPGQQIEAGSPMFRIDSATYEAAVVTARATLAQAQAALPVAESAAARAKTLEGSGSTRATVESTEAEAASARAQVQSAEAALKLAEQDLAWTTITSPISGIAGFPTVSVGDLVTQSQADALATVTRLDPIYVDLYEPAARLLSIQDQIEKGQLRPDEKLDVTLTLENGTTHNGGGTLVAPSVTVSTTTGTQDIRFRFDNPDRRLLPGMFLRGEVVVGRITAYRLPQRAATIGRNGELSVWVVTPEGKAAKKTLTAIGSEENDWLIAEGLTPGEAVIIDGLTGLREGAELTPVPVTIDAAGVVRDAAPAAGN